MIRRGLSPELRASLLSRLVPGGAPAPAPSGARDFGTLPGARDYARARELIARHVGESPFFQVQDGNAGARARVGGADLLNFSSYNYLGLNGDARVHAAAVAAMERHGTSAGASRLVSGERPVHAELEAALAANYGAEDALVLVSGHATNVSLIGHLLGPEDLVVHDQLAHNSCAEGMRLSGARRIAFPHNDADAADRALAGARARHKRALVVIEGHYSMDGTVPDLARFRDAARRHDAWLMVDEAHGLGCLGGRGRGVFEEQDVAPDAADIWMGTLSKTLASCGGFVAGPRVLVEWLRHTLPGFVYSVGLSPPLAAAALCALRLMEEEPWRVAKLRENTRRLRAALRDRGFDTGGSTGGSIVPVILGDSMRALRASQALARRGVGAQPITFPVVPEGQARLRFFVSSLHEPDDLDATAAALGEAVREAG